MDNKKQKIAVVGLGKLGACLAAILASHQYIVNGVDINTKIVNSINQRIAPVKENGLQQLLQKCGKNLVAHTDLKMAAIEAEIIFLVLPTPSKPDGKFSLSYIKKAIKKIGEGLKFNKHKFPIIVLTSTVLPGNSRQIIIPQLEKYANKKCGVGFGFCYNPEFIALGSVIKDMKNPDLVLIGEYDKASGDKLSKIYANILENKAPIERINLENAEIIKLSINTFVTTKISYANMLTSICHETPGANIDVVSQTLGLDSRIGEKYLKGGSPYGGPCFPRDNRAFVKMAKDKNIIAHLAQGTDKLNQDHLAFIIKLIQDIPSTIKKVGLLGLSYKPETSVTEESSGINLAKKLIQLKYEVSYYDPLVKEVELKKLSSKNLKSILQTNDVVIVLNNDKAYQKIRPSEIKDKIYILDCWRILNNKEWKKYPHLISLGVGKII